MKIIVAYASAGRGHQKAAEVIAGAVRTRCPRHTVVLADSLDFSLPLFKKAYLASYDFLVLHLTWLWGALFYLTSAPAFAAAALAAHSCCNHLAARRFARWLTEQNPDVIISTHFLVSDVASRLKGKNRLHARLYTVITDFGVHPFWLAGHTDCYCVASGHTRDILVSYGVNPGAIRITGIPVDPVFKQVFERRALRARYGIAPSAFVVLVVTGSFGIGPLEEIARALHGECEVLVVCARNRKLFKRLNARKLDRVQVFGFVNTMPEMMSLADLIITKPGGLSVAELLVQSLPPLFIAAIPGQESGNSETLLRYGIGAPVNDIPRLQRIIRNYLAHPEALALQRQRMKELAKPNAVEEIIDAICSGGTRSAG